jgi:NAD(P)-dependent dehydrogenase (short-subunit alcohol dehydrogenase family)
MSEFDSPPRLDLPLAERVYIVTGGGGGIGGAVVARLLRVGSSVLAVDLSSRRLAETVEKTQEFDGALRTIKVDITTEEGAAAAIELALTEFGAVHGVANVAGGMVNIDREVYDIPLESFTLASWRQMYALNIDSAFLMCRGLEKHFVAQHYGKVVNVASLAAFANRMELGNAAYNSAKAAVVAFTQSLSMQGGRLGIRANCVAPGLVLSDRVRQWIDEGYLQRHVDYTALGDLATPGDLAEGIAFFLEPQSDAITGETLRVAAGVR